MNPRPLNAAMKTSPSTTSRLLRRSPACRVGLSALLAVTAAVASGCAAENSAVPPASESELTTASKLTLMQAIVDATNEDSIALQLNDDEAGAKAASSNTGSMHLLGVQRAAESEPTLAGLPFCSIARVLKPFQHPYFFSGGRVRSLGGLLGMSIEAVVDVYNQQSAVFGLKNRYGIAGEFGASVGAYTGIAIDVRANSGYALDYLWPTERSSVAISATIDGLIGVVPVYAGASAGGFLGLNGSIVGAFVDVTAGLGTALPIGVSVDIQTAGFNPQMTRSVFGGNGRGPVHYNTARDVTNAILKVSPAGYLPGIAGLGPKLTTGFLVQAILKAKAAHTDIGALCR
jgi:hypothetical protein